MIEQFSRNTLIMKKVAVIGAGIGGLAAALRMRAKGYEVVVYEKEDKPGGKLMEFRQDGFRFDMGPSLFTLPDFVSELFFLFDEEPGNYFQYKKLDNTCNYYFPDGSLIRAWSDHQKFLEEVPEDNRSAINEYLNEARRLFESTAQLFLFNPFPSKSAFLSPEGQQIGKNPGMLDAFKTLHQRNRKTFNDSRLVQLFDRYATYNGSNPYKTPATLKMIAHLEHNIGAFFPNGGMYDIVSSLYQLAREKGIEFLFNTSVDELEMLGDGLKTVKSGKNEQIFSHVISDVDVYTFYSKILKKGKVPKAVKIQQRSSSALIFYWGMKKTFPSLDVHNILFSSDYKQEFAHLFAHKTISDDPTVYVFVSSKIVPADSPKGMENWFVMINVPENIGQDWDKLISLAKHSILKKINRQLGEDISPYIITEKIVDPREIENRTGSFRGSLYGSSSNNRFAAFLRHPNMKKKLQGVYFVGGSVHPGGGIPLCLASAKIVANQITDSNDKA